MSRVITSFVSFILVIVICITGFYYIKTSINPLVTDLEQIRETVLSNDLETAQTLIDNVTKKWHKNLKIYGTILNHYELDQIDRIFIRLDEQLKDGNTTDFLIESKELTHRLNHVIENEKPTIKNLL